MAKAKIRTKKNTIKIADFLQDAKLTETRLQFILRELNIRMAEGQKNLDIQEASAVRGWINEQRRREELRNKTIVLPSIVKAQELAKLLELPIGNVLSALLKNGVMANLNDDLDYDTAAIIAQELGYRTEESVEALEEDVLTGEKLDEILKKEDPAKQKVRPPIVTILGHVDHGKTTLLDSIRRENVAAGEAGGITQAISSYQAQHKGRTITFIDTPGHETFDFMRQHGAQLADIAVLVVAADDGVKPQTKQAAQFAKDAGIPIVVAINKMDKPGANADKVKTQLAEQLDLSPEEWGGKTVMVPVSALKKEGLDNLLEMILLTADINPPKADPTRQALGTVVESRLDKNLGSLASILIHTGTLHVGDHVAVGRSSGRVRRMLDWRNKSIQKAGPATPVTLIGLRDVPTTGDILQAVEAKEEAVQKAARGRGPLKRMVTSSDDKRPTLALVIKADSKGSLRAIEQTVTAMVPPEIRLSIVRADVGPISDSDVLTAQAAKAIMYGFNVTVAGMSKKLADKEDVVIKVFDVIYRLTDDVRQEIEERQPMDIVQEDTGRLKVLKVFFSTPKKKIIGGEIAEGFIEPNSKFIILRGSGDAREEIGHGTIQELQRERQKITKGQMGDQVGMTVEGKGKIKEGDVLKIYVEKKVKRVQGKV
ncbi:MAG: translation initiation factor IF-2 [Candidatus Andersenbacteria bacterium]|nr:translation initiation factor IF-2 [Candidatus Andersenbacteria bacterium]MBI3250730.1 translation initiation factor IF-2 [Candidatus Andersenbacteria bacterium]